MSLKEDKLRTIEYAKSFECKLSEKQIWERLLGKNIYTNSILQKQINKNNINTNIWNNNFLKKINKAKKIAKLLSINFKNILFIGATGSVAAEFPKKNDDIDLFIIVKKNTLWITRFWVRIFVFFNKIPHRKFGKKEKRNEFCFNIWLDNSALNIPKNKQNLKNAVDLVLMKKLYDKKNTYINFLKKNKWVEKWVATPYYNKLKPLISINPPKNKKERETYQLLIKNIFYFIPQYLYLKLKKQRDLIDIHRAMWGNG
jgi:hypothetical protein